jgi:putative hydrolase of the HAD superfamily
MGPKGLIFDYGGTLVQEVSVDLRAGNEWLLARASHRPQHVTVEQVLERAARITREVAGQRDHVHLETAWPTLTRLIHDFLGIRFEDSMAELEIGFWKASVHTRPMPGAREALGQFRQLGTPMAVLSNTSFGEPVIRYELGKHGLAEYLEFVMVSSDYSIRKPNALLFETAAARLGIEPKDIWFVGDRLDTDVIGAKAAGMKAVWLRSHSVSEAPAHGADLIATDWPDLVRRVQAASRRV